jgi:hypothetical protein
MIARKVEDYYAQAQRLWIWLDDKDGEQREILRHCGLTAVYGFSAKSRLTMACIVICRLPKQLHELGN